MNPSSHIHKSLTEGLAFLRSTQASDGSFATLASYSQDFSDIDAEQKTVFFVSLITSSLATLQPHFPVAKTINNKTAKYLMAQKSSHETWNYWDKNSPEAQQTPYPDDLDDTFCAAAALYDHSPEQFQKINLAALINLLTLQEEKEGGPYRTWLVPADNKKWHDVDVAVNSNVAYFLSQQKVTLPELTKLMDHAISKENYISLYYHNPLSILYFISRSYKGDQHDKIKDFFLTQWNPETAWGSPLSTALALSAIYNLQLTVDAEILDTATHYLLNTQSHGSWPAEAFYIEQVINDKPRYAGSSALTTAFCLQALHAHQQASATPNSSPDKPNASTKITNKIVASVSKRFAKLDTELANSCLEFTKAVIASKEGHEITLLPYLATRAAGAEISAEQLTQLGAASLYGWVAYTIYDDFLDEEGDPAQLPIANVCLRELSLLFHACLPEHTDFQALSSSILDKMESANAWELMACRATIDGPQLSIKHLPNYGSYNRLADRSMGHALAPIAAIYTAHPDIQQKEMARLLDFFRHYIIARQLNDDAHDWEADLRKGHINSVGRLLITKRFGSKNIHFDLDSVIAQLTQDLWHDHMPTLTDTIYYHLAQAEKALSKCRFITQPELLLSILTPVKAAADQATQERAKTLEFLANYKSLK